MDSVNTEDSSAKYYHSKYNPLDSACDSSLDFKPKQQSEGYAPLTPPLYHKQLASSSPPTESLQQFTMSLSRLSVSPKPSFHFAFSSESDEDASRNTSQSALSEDSQNASQNPSLSASLSASQNASQNASRGSTPSRHPSIVGTHMPETETVEATTPLRVRPPPQIVHTNSTPVQTPTHTTLQHHDDFQVEESAVEDETARDIGYGSESHEEDDGIVSESDFISPTTSQRERADTNGSKPASLISQGSIDDTLQRKLGKFAFWKSNSTTEKHASEQPVTKGKLPLGPPISLPPSRRGSAVTLNASTEMNSVPFPPKRESSSSSSFSDMSRFFFDSESRNRRRKTNESEARSRSSSLGMSYTSYAQRKRQHTNLASSVDLSTGTQRDYASLVGPGNGGGNAVAPVNAAANVSATTLSEPLSGSYPNPTHGNSVSSVNTGSSSGSTSLSSTGSSAHPQRPSALLRSVSSDDVRNRRALPLPPPPTIGMGTVLDDPDVRALKLDPMAVRHADHLHFLGYTRNRYVCALLAKESGKEKMKYNMMVMQAFIMRMMRFYGEPLDMSLRKFLYKMALAQESKHLERQLQCFSILWNYDNPGIFLDEEHVLCVVFSLVMLHTATFNKNVKQKMSKVDYVRNSPLDGIVPEIFEYFYDNITAMPFRAEDENGPSTPIHHNASGSGNSLTPLGAPVLHPWSSPTLGARRSPSTTSQPDFLNDDLIAPPQLSHLQQIDSPNSTHSGTESHSVSSRRSPSFIWQREQPSDPYLYLLENRLEELRSTLPTFDVEASLQFCAIASPAELDAIRHRLEDSTLSLQITSGKSKTNHRQYDETRAAAPAELSSSSSSSVPVSVSTPARPGVVDIPVVKYGVVLRREYKRMLGVGEPKPGWREWGLVLTASKLYFFKSASWIRQLGISDQQKVHISLETLQSARTISTRDIAALVKVVRQHTPRNSHSSNSESPSTEIKRRASSPPAASSSAGSGQSVLSASSVPHLAAGPRGTEVFDFMLVDGGRDASQQHFAVHTEEELRGWVQSINVIATQSSLNIGLLPSWPATVDQVRIALEDVRDQIESAQGSVSEYKRTLEHFQMLTPLQPRTREQLVFTAGRYTSRLDDSLVEITRLRAYGDILERLSESL